MTDTPILQDAAFADARYSSPTTIDMDLEHPIHGWIPITITQAEYPEIWADVIETGDVVPYEAPTPENTLQRWRESTTLTRVEFCTALRAAGILNRTEAVAAAKGDWPASFEPMLDDMTEAEADDALILWAGAAVIERTHPLLEAVRQFKGLSQEDVDALFGYKT